jgi:hypothetical protein
MKATAKAPGFLYTEVQRLAYDRAERVTEDDAYRLDDDLPHVRRSTTPEEQAG